MSNDQGSRLLSIGQFAAATQLTQKALRLYDEQRLLRPAKVDAANGYRYYRADQVVTGRLIRTLRATSLSLAQIAQIVAAQDRGAETLLRLFAQEADRRYAGEKRAFQTALVAMRPVAHSSAPVVIATERPAATVVVRPFTVDRRHFIERYAAVTQEAREAAATARLAPAGEPLCLLIEPLADEEGQLELVLPVVAPATVPTAMTLRSLPAGRYASVSIESHDGRMPDLTAALDALFDWFDQSGHRAAETPLLAVQRDGARLQLQALWAFAPAASAG